VSNSDIFVYVPREPVRHTIGSKQARAIDSVLDPVAVVVVNCSSLACLAPSAAVDFASVGEPAAASFSVSTYHSASSAARSDPHSPLAPLAVVSVPVLAPQLVVVLVLLQLDSLKAVAALSLDPHPERGLVVFCIDH